MSTVPSPEHPDDRPEDGTSPISDEQWNAFLRDSVQGDARKAPEEPSARERMVTRRLREQDEVASGRAGSGRRRWGRKAAAEPAPALPPGWRTGPAWQEMNGRSGRGRTVRSLFAVVLVAALAVVAVRPSLLLDRLPGHQPDAAAAAAEASPSPLPAETAQPSSAPAAAVQTARPTREHPFRGSPAERWASGADAIELPRAKATGGMSKADVALALRRTKEFLVATNLDPAVLRGGQPTAAMSLLDPQQPEVLPGLRRSLSDPDEKHDPLDMVTRFDPADVVLAGDVVKVRGHLTFSAGKPGEVRVHADYSFVYPTVRAGADSDVVARTIVRRDVTLALLDPHKWMATKGRLTVGDYTSESANSACGVHDGYYHPGFPNDDAPAGDPATGPAEDPYDRSRSLREDENEGCGTVIRT
ncbi:hypothetical protein [Streptomyces sp. NPDC048462]|uniref:hypothetical protein n=1 Tax=Streptomyces sp. NPDC048462 TaxID=3365555 RepID=UPI0037206BA1